MGCKFYCDLCGSELDGRSSIMSIESDLVHVHNHPFLPDGDLEESVDMDVCVGCLQKIFKSASSFRILKDKKPQKRRT